VHIVERAAAEAPSSQALLRRLDLPGKSHSRHRKPSPLFVIAVKRTLHHDFVAQFQVTACHFIWTKAPLERICIDPTLRTGKVASRAAARPSLPLDSDESSLSTEDSEELVEYHGVKLRG
jgi:hypothetical protein